jgi:myosin-crossreactive antigen
MSEKNFTCKQGNREVSCGPPGCICIQLGPDEIDCRCIGDIYKTTPDNSKEVSEIDEFIDKVKRNINTTLFTIKMAEMQLSEIADFLEMFVPEVKAPENKLVTLQAEKKTMRDIISDLGLEIGKANK